MININKIVNAFNYHARMELPEHKTQVHIEIDKLTKFQHAPTYLMLLKLCKLDKISIFQCKQTPLYEISWALSSYFLPWRGLTLLHSERPKLSAIGLKHKCAIHVIRPSYSPGMNQRKTPFS